MPTIQPAEIWRESGRYEDYGKEMLRITDRHEREMLYGPTNEELITQIFRDAVKSYKELPRILYHIQWKFRDEIRPRFGVMRGREFLMKDSYSFDLDLEDARRSYNKMFVSYLRTFARMGLKSIPMAADTGPIGGDLSHEFIILADTGESEVYCHRDLLALEPPGADLDYEFDLVPLIKTFTGKYASTDEKHDAARFAKEVPAKDRVTARGIEVGHIFFFGTKYSEAMGCKVQGPDGDLVDRADGLLRYRRVAARRRHHRGLTRRGRHHLAALCRALRCRPDQREGRRPRDGQGVRGALCKDRSRGPERALRRPRRQGRCQVRRHGPDRPALASRGRTQRPRVRRGRTEGACDRRPP